jgi:uncharacterized phage protein (TIGR01671 family)
MKREIKFRAWAIAEKKMCNITTLTDRGAFLVGIEPMADQFIDNGKFIVESCKEGRCLNNGEFELMQFTGLLDRNGKEIYEGDIVTYSVWERFHESETIRRTKVKYQDNLCGFSPMAWHTQVEDEFYNYEIENIEVIGNIYESPNILSYGK